MSCIKFYNDQLHVCKRSLGWINYDGYVHIAQPDAKSVPNCNYTTDGIVVGGIGSDLCLNVLCA